MVLGGTVGHVEAAEDALERVLGGQELAVDNVRDRAPRDVLRSPCAAIGADATVNGGGLRWAGSRPQRSRPSPAGEGLKDLTSNHDVLLGPAELYVDDAKEALVFRHENQGATSWGILLDTLQGEDPAVFIRLDLADKSAERWEDWLERLSLCFVEIILSESLQADEELCDYLDPDGDSLELLETHSVRLPFPVYPVGEETRWFLGHDVLLRDDDGAAILARGRTADDLDRVRDLIPGDWLNDHR